MKKGIKFKYCVIGHVRDKKLIKDQFLINICIKNLNLNLDKHAHVRKRFITRIKLQVGQSGLRRPTPRQGYHRERQENPSILRCIFRFTFNRTRHSTDSTNDTTQLKTYLSMNST
jgi:hypothetical protein